MQLHNDDGRFDDIPAVSSLPIPEVTASLQVVFCRFDSSGKLVRESLPVPETRYITISHAWESATWQKISAIEDKVLGDMFLVSEEKAKFIVEQLPSLVGADWFWMDVLCVNQCDKAARVAVTQHIPNIF